MPSIDPRQLSLFNSDGAAPALVDLDGLMFGTGHVVSRGGESRVSVLVADSWRANALLAEFEARGLVGEVETNGRHLLSVRTSFTPDLVPLASRWEPSARRETSAHATAAALRLWVTASGRPDDVGYLLRLAPSEPGRWERAGAALSSLGLAGPLLGPRAGGPAYRVTSARRLHRLHELVGTRPLDVPPDAWPLPT